MFADRRATAMIPAKDVERHVAWYADKLGLKPPIRTSMARAIELNGVIGVPLQVRLCRDRPTHAAFVQHHEPARRHAGACAARAWCSSTTTCRISRPRMASPPSVRSRTPGPGIPKATFSALSRGCSYFLQRNTLTGLLSPAAMRMPSPVGPKIGVSDSFWLPQAGAVGAILVVGAARCRSFCRRLRSLSPMTTVSASAAPQPAVSAAQLPISGRAPGGSFVVAARSPWAASPWPALSRRSDRWVPSACCCRRRRAGGGQGAGKAAKGASANPVSLLLCHRCAVIAARLCSGSDHVWPCRRSLWMPMPVR